MRISRLICIAATPGSEYLQACLNSIPWSYPVVHNDTTPGYDTGKYQKMFREVESGAYCFMHDSCEILDSSILKDGFDIAEAGKVAAFATFTPNWDDKAQEDWCQQSLGSTHYKAGIFGPMFFATAEAMRRACVFINEDPCNKRQQQAMERGWAIAFEQAGIEVVSLDGQWNGKQLPRFKKHFPRRP